jgi:hypothetical protein
MVPVVTCPSTTVLTKVNENRTKKKVLVCRIAILLIEGHGLVLVAIPIS